MMSSEPSQRGSLRRTDNMISRGHFSMPSVRSIDSISSVEMRGSSRSIMSSRYTRKSSIRSISSRGSNIGEIDNPTDEEEKTQQKDKVRLQKIEQDTKKRRKEQLQEDSTSSLAAAAAAGRERIAVIKEYTRLLVERAGQNSKVAEEELKKERQAHQETKARLLKVEQEAEERKRELQYLQARQSSWVMETIKLAAVGLGVLFLRRLFVLALSGGEYAPIY